MFAKCGKKEVWLGTALEPDVWGNPQLEINWGRPNENGDCKYRVVISFEDFVDDMLGHYERGGPNSGGEYDDEIDDAFKRMRAILKRARKHVRKRNGV